MILGMPPIRQELLQLAHVRGRDTGQDAGEVALRVQAMAFGTGNEAVERGGSLSGDIMPREKPFLSTDSDSAHGTFGGVVIDVEEALSRIDAQPP